MEMAQGAGVDPSVQMEMAQGAGVDPSVQMEMAQGAGVDVDVQDVSVVSDVKSVNPV